MLHVIAGLSPHNGGPSYSVPRLGRALRKNGCRVDLLTVSDTSILPVDPTAQAYPHRFASIPFFAELRFSSDLKKALAKKAQNADIIHNHGLWLMPNVYAGHAARKGNSRLVVSPRGMLATEALKFSALKKRVFWTLLQKPAFASAAVWHATSIEEANDIRSMGIEAPIGVIANGIHLPERTATHAANGGQKTLLFLSRIHPKKNLPDLIDAWALVSAQRPDWRLVVAGPDEAGHRTQLEILARSRGAESIVFTGAVYGKEKDALLESADLFVLTTRNENFGLAIAEALAAGVPAIVTRGAPWAGLETERCGWWIDHGVEPLTAALLKATALPAAVRREMGARGRAWMARDYTWSSVAGQMIELYSWIGGNAERPSFVR